jgi:hypothetical protein
LTLKYFDVSAGNFIVATASVDTNSPTITGVDSDADYQQAVVFWDTSEFADSLVQFGESPILTRTAYNPDLTSNHMVTLFGLVPNRTYYYQVVSRDVAGNTAVANNNSNLYTLKTLLPLFSPWSDNMNSGATNWSVFSADDSQSEWTLGVPANGLQTTAHSPPAAWGSNRDGQPIDYTETLLISPAIYLTNGNVVKLNFWHSYDFSGAGDLTIESAEVQIVYNNGSSLASLAAFDDFTDDWEPVQIDLSPYAGQVVYFVWYYLLFSFDSTDHPGWLVDDVSVTVSNLVPGTVQISNNIWQASYILSGPAYRKAKGLSTVISNAPPGPYILEFADIPYYITPPAQTNTLAPGATINFQGNYTFADVNSNNIPDPWELERFGSINPQRTQTTDTDHDTLSDWAEFVAGTDPNNSLPGFRLTARPLTNNLLEISWPSQTNYTYRLHTSSNLLSWSPYTAWFTATGAQTSFVLSSTTNLNRYFRVEATLPGASSTLAPLFRATATRLVNGQTRLQWPSAVGHGYRVLGTTNLTQWSPFSGWIRAASKNTGLTLPPRTNGAPFLFRIEAQP